MTSSGERYRLRRGGGCDAPNRRGRSPSPFVSGGAAFSRYVGSATVVPVSVGLAWVARTEAPGPATEKERAVQSRTRQRKPAETAGRDMRRSLVSGRLVRHAPRTG